MPKNWMFRSFKKVSAVKILKNKLNKNEDYFKALSNEISKIKMKKWFYDRIIYYRGYEMEMNPIIDVSEDYNSDTINF